MAVAVGYTITAIAMLRVGGPVRMLVFHGTRGNRRLNLATETARAGALDVWTWSRLRSRRLLSVRIDPVLGHCHRHRGSAMGRVLSW